MPVGLTAHLEKAFDRRQKLLQNLESEGTDAYRLFGGEKEGIPGLVVERFASGLTFQYFENRCQLDQAELKLIGKWYLEKLGVNSVYLKRFVPDRSKTLAGPLEYSESAFLGKSDASVIIRERKIRYQTRFNEGFSTGLFLDQRENRRYVASLSQGKRVLNTFAYTCGFSLVCALSGAQVTSVDLSKKYLDWGKENFQLNDCDVKAHRFCIDDTRDYFRRAIKREEKYDWVILDPPSFSRNKKGRVFSLQRDWLGLVTNGFSLLSPKGRLFFSSNFSVWNSDWLKRTTQKALAKEGQFQIEALPEMPIDFALGGHLLSGFLIQKA